MRFCIPHWESLREAIDRVGLASLVSESGESAAANFASQISDGSTIDNYDPLMSAMMAIWNNAMRIAEERGGNPLGMMLSDPQHPEWECPVCFLNEMSRVHDAQCTQEECVKGATFDWMIDRAANEELKAWKEMRP